jgi:hypothetical protein
VSSRCVEEDIAEQREHHRTQAHHPKVLSSGILALNPYGGRAAHVMNRNAPTQVFINVEHGDTDE